MPLLPGQERRHPTSAAALPPTLTARLLLVACCLLLAVLAGLYLLHLQPPGSNGIGTVAAAWQAVKTSCPLAVPDVLLHVPVQLVAAAADQHEQPQAQLQQQQQPQQEQQERDNHLAALVVLGSRSSSSQVVALTAAFVDAAGLQQPQLQGQQQGLPMCPVLQSAFVPSLAGAQAVAAYQDPSGVVGVRAWVCFWVHWLGMWVGVSMWVRRSWEYGGTRSVIGEWFGRWHAMLAGSHAITPPVIPSTPSLCGQDKKCLIA